jgi:hypothetical protein
MDSKNILDFAWSADRDYSVESFNVPEGPKVYLVYQKNDKTKVWEKLSLILPNISRL